jgi:hypothetical protein
LIAAFSYLQRGQSWEGDAGLSQQGLLKKSFKTAGLFFFFLLLAWQINYLSLYEAQPLMYTEDKVPIRYDISPGDLLGYTLRLVAQTWVLSLALAIAINRVPRNGEYGFIRGNFRKTGGLAWYVSNMSGVGVTITLLFSLGLLTLDLGKFLAKTAGADVMLTPQLELFLFLFSLYMFSVSMGFSKKIRALGKDSDFSLMGIVLIQMVFFLGVYCFSRLLLHFLPSTTLYSLMEPFYFEFIDHNVFSEYWQLFTLCLSLFTVPLLAHYFYHACQGEPVGRSLLRLLIIPGLICLGLMQVFPNAQTVFFEVLPSLTMHPVVLDDLTIRYEISWISYLSAILLMGLMLCLQRSKHLIQSLVDVMPEHLGYRVRRLKAYYSRTFSFWIVVLVMYLLAGVMFSVYFTSLFLMGSLLGFVLCFIAGFKPKEA